MGYGSIEIQGQDEILQKMIDIVVTRTRLTDLLPASELTQILGAAARSDEAIYFQVAKLIDLFALKNAQGTDLDLRLADYDVEREGAQYATTVGNFVRGTSSGLLNIPAGTEIATESGEIFRTLVPTFIADANTTSPAVSAIAAEPGEEGNVDAGTITVVITPFSGPEATGLTFSNSSSAQGGLEEESDDSARQRAIDKVLGLNKTSPPSMDAVANQVSLSTGEEVKTTNLVESLVIPGRIDLWIDNGTGLTETTEEVTSGIPEVLITSAIGGERRFKTLNFPIARDGSDVPIITVELNSVPLVLGTDYHVKSGTGDIHLDETVYPTGLSAADNLETYYTYYTGLIQEVQQTLDGVGSDPETYPGGRAAGADLIVRAPSRFLPAIEMTVVVSAGFDVLTVKNNVQTTVINTINALGIGDDIILVRLTDAAAEVDGVFDVFFNVPVPQDPPLNIAVGDDQIARATTSSVIIN